MTLRCLFDGDIAVVDRTRIESHLQRAVQSSDIVRCPCSTVYAWIYETRPPDFQASISCDCGLIRPLYSSTPDADD